MRVVVALGMLAVCAGASASAQDDGFVVPQPETGRPAAAAAPSPARSTGTTRRRAAEAPVADSLCQEMVRDWVDVRPVRDVPALEGRVPLDMQQAALRICATEQQAKPGDKRVTFAYARTLEVNGRNARAVQLYQQLAGARYLPAMTQLARAYYTGAGLPRNVIEACNRYVAAAKAGDKWALNPAADCAMLHTAVPDPRHACQYYRKAVASDTVQTLTLTEADYCP